MSGRPRGKRFKEIAADLQAMARGEVAETVAPSPRPEKPAERQPTEAKQEAPTFNVPLKRSPNERARALTDLDEKFLVEPGESMNKDAAAFFRKRPFLTPEVCRKWRMGYLPRHVGGDNAGGTMRGKIVYPVLSEKGDVLTWFGRDPGFEGKHAEWEARAKQGREPEKYHFVKGFHRGLELFGQQASRLEEPGYRERIAEMGILVVEGPNDVIALDSLGVPAVGLCSNTVTDAQVAKIARWADELAGNRVTLMLDCDEEGEAGAAQALWQLAHQCSVRLAWSRDSHGGQFAGRQPESVTAEEWEELRRLLAPE